ncbi:MAG: GntR family transcriptional regulator, partial [Muribaculaceae bacterium]|nr:GntR family transcriptional regulator [Muribaculaceae bacterium]
MISIGNFNELRIERFVEHGAYLVEPDDDAHSRKPGSKFKEVLLPTRYVSDKMVVGDIIKVFVYTDSEDRPVATTEIPYATVGEFAFLQVAQVNRVGAFLDWGLSKNLLVPFKEQRVKMCPGGIYPVYIYLDTATNRVVASAKLEKYLGNVYPD